MIILASHIPDGIAFRQAMVAAGLKVGALIGSTMAECDPDFAGELGADAIGVFASDRPDGGFQPGALGADAAAAYARFAPDWAKVPKDGAGAGDQSRGGYGDDSSGRPLRQRRVRDPRPRRGRHRRASEEALAGFTAGWALFRHVLPGRGARPAGNGRGARRLGRRRGCANSRPARRLAAKRGRPALLARPARLGQNERAAAVIWQWQAVRTYAFVWPPTYATGHVAFVPLAR